MTRAVPNGAIGRTKSRRLFFWREGASSGTPDIIVLFPGQSGPSKGKPMVIEMKFGDGKLSKEQVEFRDDFIRTWGPECYCLAYSGAEAAIAWCKQTRLTV